MQLLPHEILIVSLEQRAPTYWGHLYRSKEAAYEELKGITGQDFGYDGRAWERWFSENEFEVAYAKLGEWTTRDITRYPKEPLPFDDVNE